MAETKIKEQERILKALANRRRLAILKYLRVHKQASVSEVAEAMRLSFRATSRHLNTLFNADILSREQIRLTVYYRLSKKPGPIASKVISLG